jgi:hypothetical protein
MRAFIPISALAIALASGAAAAAGGNERHGGSAAAVFESLDRNSDRRLSQQEASSDESVAGKFAALDVDGDGYITQREFTARMEKDQKDQKDRQMNRSEPRNPMPEDNRKPYGGMT